jgi:hypothetical protein
MASFIGGIINITIGAVILASVYIAIYIKNFYMTRSKEQLSRQQTQHRGAQVKWRCGDF